MSDPQTTAFDKLLIAQSEHAAAMYDLGWAVGANAPKGNAERNLSETSRKFVAATKKMKKELSCQKIQ